MNFNKKLFRCITGYTQKDITSIYGSLIFTLRKECLEISMTVQPIVIIYGRCILLSKIKSYT
jgi:hypothetical protein